MAAHNIDSRLRNLIAAKKPAALAAGSFLSQSGLSGNTLLVGEGTEALVARQQPDPDLPWVDRRREYRQLRRLQNSQLAPKALGWDSPWLLVEHIQGQPLSNEQFASRIEDVAMLLGTLHHQPLSGFRLSLPQLLDQYWQRCRQHSPQWQRRWRRLRQQGEPRPLRLAPLHMDVHPGNVIDEGKRLRLIDWEYAGDGDVALELAALYGANSLTNAQYQRLLQCYAQQNGVAVDLLGRRITAWQPWLSLLMACWYQLRAEQSENVVMQLTAAMLWQQQR